MSITHEGRDADTPFDDEARRAADERGAHAAPYATGPTGQIGVTAPTPAQPNVVIDTAPPGSRRVGRRLALRAGGLAALFVVEEVATRGLVTGAVWDAIIGDEPSDPGTGPGTGPGSSAGPGVAPSETGSAIANTNGLPSPNVVFRPAEPLGSIGWHDRLAQGADLEEWNNGLRWLFPALRSPEDGTPAAECLERGLAVAAGLWSEPAARFDALAARYLDPNTGITAAFRAIREKRWIVSSATARPEDNAIIFFSTQGNDAQVTAPASTVQGQTTVREEKGRTDNPTPPPVNVRVVSAAWAAAHAGPDGIVGQNLAPQVAVPTEGLGAETLQLWFRRTADGQTLLSGITIRADGPLGGTGTPGDIPLLRVKYSLAD